MKFEIIEAYKIKMKKSDEAKGWSLHIYFPDIKMDIRGIMIKKTVSGWWCQMPYLRNWDDEEKRVVTFPMISFLDSEEMKDLREEIKKNSIEFIQKKLEV